MKFSDKRHVWMMLELMGVDTGANPKEDAEVPKKWETRVLAGAEVFEREIVQDSKALGKMSVGEHKNAVIHAWDSHEREYPA